MLNQIVLMGRLVWDPELRHTQAGTPVASFRLAVDRDYKAQDGTREADFIDITAWRGTAELVSKYFSKGRLVAVSGRLQIRPWTDQDGKKRTAAEVVAENVYFADSRREGSYAPPEGTCAAPVPASEPPAVDQYVNLDGTDEDLPF